MVTISNPDPNHVQFVHFENDLSYCNFSEGSKNFAHFAQRYATGHNGHFDIEYSE